MTLHGSQQRVDRGEVVRGPGQRHTGLFGDGAVGDGRESAGDGDPSRGLDDRLAARRAAGTAAVGSEVDHCSTICTLVQIAVTTMPAVDRGGPAVTDLFTNPTATAISTRGGAKPSSSTPAARSTGSSSPATSRSGR